MNAPIAPNELTRTCENCGDTFTRRRNPGAQPEQLVRFRERRFCSHECSRGNFPGATIDDRFLAKVDKRPDGCWLWTAGLNDQGYGRFAISYRDPIYAHRWSYERHVGPIPDGLTIDHLCRVTNCVNPEHLEPVTQAENNRRARAAAPPRKPREPRVRVQKRRQSCDHEMTPENTITRRDGVRWCRTCREAMYRRRVTSA